VPGAAPARCVPFGGSGNLPRRLSQVGPTFGPQPNAHWKSQLQVCHSAKPLRLKVPAGDSCHGNPLVMYGRYTFAGICAISFGLINHRMGGFSMNIFHVGASALLAAVLAACSATPETGSGAKENTGTLIGALTGGLIGSQFGGGTGERVAAGLAGAAVGGLIGNRIGASMDEEDRRRAYAAQIQALESGRSGAAVAWRNPDSGRYGSIVPGPAYQSNGLQCRPYTHTIYIDGRPQVAQGNACRNPDGTWTAVG